MSEGLVLDPVEVATPDREALDLNNGAIRVGDGGPDWGSSTISPYLADGKYGSVPVDLRRENRTITIPLMLNAGRDGDGLSTPRTALERKVGELQERGGWLKRDRTSVGNLYADVLWAELTEPDSKYANLTDDVAFIPDVVLVLTTLSDFYGDEEEVDLGTAVGELTATIEDVKGAFPARMRATITELSGFAQHGALAAFRSKGTGVPWVIDLSGVGTVNGSPTLWLPFYDLGSLAHVGPHRVWLLAAGTASVGLEWGPDGALNREPTSPATIGSADTVWTDLGEVMPSGPLIVGGTNTWAGRLALGPLPDLGSNQGAPQVPTITPDRLLILPTGEAYTRIDAPARQPTIEPDVYDDFAALDDFDELDGTTAPTGQDWAATPGEFGATSDEHVGSGIEHVNRIHDDGAVTDGEFALLGADVYTDLASSVGLLLPAAASRGGIVARYVDANNWLMAVLDSSSFGRWVRLIRCVGGDRTGLGVMRAINSLLTITLTVDAEGNFTVTQASAFGDPSPQEGPGFTAIRGTHPTLRTGGALESGQLGLYDGAAGHTQARRYFALSAQTAPARDSVLVGDSIAELRTEGYFRASAPVPTPGAFVPITPLGDDPRLPVGDPVEVLIRTTPGDFNGGAELHDPHISAVLHYRPSYLFSPVGSS